MGAGARPCGSHLLASALTSIVFHCGSAAHGGTGWGSAQASALLLGPALPQLQGAEHLSRPRPQRVAERAWGLARQPRAVVWGPGELWPWPQVPSTSALQVLTCPNASFTDLAEIVSRIEPAKAATVDGESGLRVHTCTAEGDIGSVPV